MNEVLRCRNYLAGKAQEYLKQTGLELGVIVLVVQKEVSDKIEYAGNVSDIQAAGIMQEAAKDRLATDKLKQVN